jgi:hypothetical protein
VATGLMPSQGRADDQYRFRYHWVCLGGIMTGRRELHGGALLPEQIRRLRLRAQRLGSGPDDVVPRVADIVRDAAGIQAKEMPAAALSVRVRDAGLTAADIERALVDERSIVWIWGQRGTLHLLPAEDSGWLLPLLGPIFNRPSRRRLELGLDEETGARGVRAIWICWPAGDRLHAPSLPDTCRHGASRPPGKRWLTSYTGPRSKVSSAVAPIAAPSLPMSCSMIGSVPGVPCRERRPWPSLPTDIWRRMVRHGRKEDLVAWSGLPLRDARTG